MKITLLLMLFLIFNFPIVFAEDLLITWTDADDNIILDGKWSEKHEWKKSSETIINNEDGQRQLALRYAHNYEEIFLLVDVINDNSINNFLNPLKDKATLCFQNMTNTTKSSNSIYCFEKTFDGDFITSIKNSEISEFEIIKNFENSFADSSISDEFDRYSKIPHVSYEFKIPINEIGRSDIYRFYVEVFDSEKNQKLIWSKNLDNSKSLLHNPASWGFMISPDKSIPEFSSPLIIMIILIGILVTIQFKTKLIYKRF